MPGLIADNDVRGPFQHLLYVLQGKSWHDLWTALNFKVQTFAALGLSPNAIDVVIWQACQQHEVVLVTGNRKQEGPNSLEAAIRHFNTPDCLPVITLADADRISKDKPYARRTAERLVDYLFELEIYRGAGRLYVP